MRKVLLALFALLFSASFAFAQNFTPVRVNCGGNIYSDTNGDIWAADNNFSGGLAYSQATATAPVLNQSIRYAPQGGSFFYTFPVPNGAYNVNFSFQELWGSHRSINVLINSVTVLSRFDVFAKAGNLPDIESFPVTVSTGSIIIELDSLGGNGYIDAIEILSAAPPSPLQITFPGSNGGTGFTATFPIFNISQVPSCGLSDGVCSLTLLILDANGNVITTGNVGSVAMLKTFNGGTLTVPVVAVAP